MKGTSMLTTILSKPLLILVLIEIACVATAPAAANGDTPWAKVTETDLAIKIETDKLEAVIPKKNPKRDRSTFRRLMRL